MTRFAILYGSDPWQQTDGGTVRVQRLVSALEPYGVSVVFPSSATSGLPAASRRKAFKQHFLPLPVRRRALLEEVKAGLERVDAEFVISASHALTPVALGHRGAGVWVDHFDLWSDFGRREASSRSGLARLTSLAQARLWAQREQSERQRYDVATAASYGDASRLHDALWMPTPVPRRAPRLSSPGGRVAGFLANFAYWPNLDAYDVLVTQWAPELQRQGWSVVVAGFGADELGRRQGVSNMGPVRSVTEFYDSVDLVLAPVRLGGGMKVKVVEALAHGCPVLATRHAVDGLPPSLRRYAVVADGPPSDLDAALSGLDWSPSLIQDLEPYQPEAFTRTAVHVVGRLLEAAP